MTEHKKKVFEHWRMMALLLMGYDIVAVNLAYLLALWVRFDCHVSAIPVEYTRACLSFSPIYAGICLLTFWRMRLYNSIWRYASLSELCRVIISSLLTSVVHALGITLLFQKMPVSYYILGPGFQFLLILGIRFSYRFVLHERDRNRSHSTDDQVKNVMIIGAGSAGQLIQRDIMHMRNEYMKVCCFIDDNRNKWDRYVNGVPVAGGRNDIMANVKKYNIKQILLAMPSAANEDKRDILNICKETGCELKNLPGVYQMITGPLTVGDMKDVAVEDLLGRDPIKVNMEAIYSYIKDKVILVTGGGGSIGSELCRQVAAHQPKQLIIFDIYENNAYDIHQELKEKYPELNLTVLIGSVRDSRRINSVFAAYHPDIVYHAAAHKHVPLMEDSPCEAIKNNVVGTYKTAYAAAMNGCKRFVLISTDKAVNPTNIMGASKRLCEMVIQSFDRAIKAHQVDALPVLYTHDAQGENDMEAAKAVCQFCTEYVAVRFGNVLGSNGSVIPLFQKQIARGGPVTVTHPDIIRYFMTIPEAVSLVLQAGTYAHGGEIFVLDMGAPVKIDDLARNLIKLSGHKPDVDIPIKYIGLRPGEKLYEEKLMAEEGLQRTENELIHIGTPIQFDIAKFAEQLKKLLDHAYENDPEIGKLVEEIVETYHPVHLGAETRDDTFQKLYQKAVEPKRLPGFKMI